MPTLLTEPPITAEEVYRRFREHFSSMGQTELLAAVRSALPNTKKRHYREYAQTNIEDRAKIVADMTKLAYRYFVQRQPEGYLSKYGRASRVPYLPIANEYQALELLTDFYLSEDLADGLTLRDRFREDTDENSLEYPPLGGAARAYQDMEMNLLTPAMMVRRKVCEVCKSYFIDTSPAKNAKRCGPRCTRWAEMLRVRRFRNDGDDRKVRDRERQQHEYPFYSPYELEHINTFPERCYSDEAIERKVRARKLGGRKKPQGITMDSAQVSGHFKRYNPSSTGESGPVTIQHRRPEVVRRFLRMKYGERADTPYR